MRTRRAVAALLVAASVLVALPATAAAGSDVGSTIFQRFWDSLVSTWKNRTESQAPVWLTWIEQGEEIFLGETTDLTQHPAAQDAVAAMRGVGAVLLALCVVLSLSELTVAHMTGGGFSLLTWFWRFLVATVMTFGTLPIAGAVLGFANHLLQQVRDYMDQHWTGNLTDLYQGFFDLLGGGATQILLVLLFLAVLSVLILCLWFLFGGIRTAEVVIHLLLWPLTWPLYLLPSLEDIPKAATRGFIMWAALPILVSLMLRTGIRMVIQGDLWGTIWAFVPAIALVAMTVFLPMAVRRVIGQGNTGASLVATMFRVAAGFKVAAVAGAAGAAAAAPAPAGGASAAPATARRPLQVLAPPQAPPWAGTQHGSPFSEAAFSYMDGGAIPPPAGPAGALPQEKRSVSNASELIMRNMATRNGKTLFFPSELRWADGFSRDVQPDDMPDLPIVIHKKTDKEEDG